MLDKLKSNKDVLNIYTYGSRVYGTATAESDFDFVVVVTENYPIEEDTIEVGLAHFNFFTLKRWKEMVKCNHIIALECSFLKEVCIIKEDKKIELEVDIVELRKSISSVVSNSYVKCRKKLEVEKDFNPYIAKKSLWHSIRILLFGLQLVKEKKITDYGVANEYYSKIVQNPCNDWDYYKETWDELLKGLRSEFRTLTEREWQEWKKLSS